MLRLLAGLIGLAGIVLAFPVLFTGGTLVAIDQTMTDADGFLSTRTLDIEVDGFALVAGPAEIEEIPQIATGPFDAADIATLRVRAQTLDSEAPLFLGLARSEDVNAYLGSVPHASIDEVDRDGFVLTYQSGSAASFIALPEEQPFWILSTTGTDQLVLEWAIEEGDYSFVVMNDDGSDGMALTADLGVQVPLLGPLGIGLLVGGGITLAIGTLLLAIVL